MPFAKPETDKPDVQYCPDCKAAMVVTLAVPLASVPGFEDVFYECPACRYEVKRTAIPM